MKSLREVVNLKNKLLYIKNIAKDNNYPLMSDIGTMVMILDWVMNKNQEFEDALNEGVNKLKAVKKIQNEQITKN